MTQVPAGLPGTPPNSEQSWKNARDPTQPSAIPAAALSQDTQPTVPPAEGPGLLAVTLTKDPILTAATPLEAPTF